MNNLFAGHESGPSRRWTLELIWRCSLGWSGVPLASLLQSTSPPSDLRSVSKKKTLSASEIAVCSQIGINEITSLSDNCETKNICERCGRIWGGRRGGFG